MRSVVSRTSICPTICRSTPRRPTAIACARACTSRAARWVSTGKARTSCATRDARDSCCQKPSTCWRAVSAALADAGVSDGRTVELSENRAATERALFLEVSTMGRGAMGLEALLDLEGVTGIGVARAGTPLAAVGSPIVSDEIVLQGATGHTASLRLQRHVTGFFQGNRFLLQLLIERVLAHVPDGPMTDLYAGVGLFGLAHAALGRGDVLAVEGDAGSVEDLQANAAPYAGPGACRRAVGRRCAPTSRHGGWADAPSSIRPEQGCRARPLAALAAARPPRLVYVSCDVATLARDAAALVAAGFVTTQRRGLRSVSGHGARRDRRCR